MRLVVQMVKPDQKDGKGRRFDEVWLADKFGRQSVIRFESFPAKEGQVLEIKPVPVLGADQLAITPPPPAKTPAPPPPPAEDNLGGLGVEISPESQVVDYVDLLV